MLFVAITTQNPAQNMLQAPTSMKSLTESKSLEMEARESDELLDPFFDMTFLMVDGLLEDFGPPESLSEHSSPPLLTDSGELVSSSPQIPDVTCSESQPQNPECIDDVWVNDPTRKASMTSEKELTSEARSSHVSPFSPRDLELKDIENASQYDEDLGHVLHRRMKRPFSPRRTQAKRKIWGVISTYDKKSSMDVVPDWDNVSYVPKSNPSAVPSTSELMGCNRGSSTSIPGQAAGREFNVINLDLDTSDGMEENEHDSRSAKSKKKGMSRNLISERRRRRKLNEKLYSLRALVPNISKMDKASIIADAISYVKDLKSQVEVMHEKVLHLAATHDAIANGLLSNSNTDSTSKVDFIHDPPTQQHRYRIVKFTMTHLQDQIYQLQIHCQKSSGHLWLQLTQAIEALGYDTKSANFSYINGHMLNNLIIEVHKEQIVSDEKICNKMMQTMLEFGFVFDMQKTKP